MSGEFAQVKGCCWVPVGRRRSRVIPPGSGLVLLSGDGCSPARDQEAAERPR